MRLTLRTLLAYLDDTLEPSQAALIGHKLNESPEALRLVEKIRKVTRRRGLSTPPSTGTGTPSDPNTVAGYLSDTLPSDQLHEFESTCLESDTHLAEVAACHQILTLLLTEQMRVPPTAYQRMYKLVKGRESVPGRRPGHVIPVGGVVESRDGAFDDSDVPFLLGMSDAGKRGGASTALRWGLAAALAAGFVLAVILVWPKATERGPGPVAVVTPQPDSPPVKPPVKPDPGPVDPLIKPPDPPMPVDDVPPPPRLVVEPPPPEPVNPLLELVPAKTPPRPGRKPVATVDAAEPPLFSRKAGDDTWAVVVGEKAAVFSSDRVVCLPGFKVKVKPDGGQMLLWGNLPEVFPLPGVLDATVTLHDPYAGFAGDFTLHVGRVYLTAAKPGGAAFRVRFKEEIWDITLPDEKAEVVVEVGQQPTPGVDEPPHTLVLLYVATGSAAFRSRHKEFPKLVAGDDVSWSSRGAGLAGPMKPDAKGKPDPKEKRNSAAYFSRLNVSPNAAEAKQMLGAVDAAGKRLVAAQSVPGVVSELIADEAPDQSVALVGVYAAAALGEFGRVADAVNDDKRPRVRFAGRLAARKLFANPDGDVFFKEASKKLRLDKEGEQAFSAGLRGLTDREKTSPAVLDLIVKKLESDEVGIRDLAFELLVFQIDPAALKIKALFLPDWGAPADIREPFVAAWRKRAEELKKNFPE